MEDLSTVISFIDCSTNEGMSLAPENLAFTVTEDNDGMPCAYIIHVPVTSDGSLLTGAILSQSNINVLGDGKPVAVIDNLQSTNSDVTTTTNFIETAHSGTQPSFIAVTTESAYTVAPNIVTLAPTIVSDGTPGPNVLLCADTSLSENKGNTGTSESPGEETKIDISPVTQIKEELVEEKTPFLGLVRVPETNDARESVTVNIKTENEVKQEPSIDLTEVQSYSGHDLAASPPAIPEQKEVTQAPKINVHFPKKPAFTYGKGPKASKNTTNHTSVYDNPVSKAGTSKAAMEKSQVMGRKPTEIVSIKNSIVVSKPEFVTIRSRRKRRLIIDTQKQIPIGEYKKQLLNTKDIVLEKRDMAPPTKKAMKAMENAGVGKIFCTPGRSLTHLPLYRLFYSRLVIAPEPETNPGATSLLPLDADLRIPVPLQGSPLSDQSEESTQPSSPSNFNALRDKLLSSKRSKKKVTQKVSFRGSLKPPTSTQYPTVPRKSTKPNVSSDSIGSSDKNPKNLDNLSVAAPEATGVQANSVQNRLSNDVPMKEQGDLAKDDVIDTTKVKEENPPGIEDANCNTTKIKKEETCFTSPTLLEEGD